MSETIQYPECEKMKAVEKESRIISSFLDWLSEKDIALCKLEPTGDIRKEFFMISTTHERLLAEHFNIDLDRVEKERRAILAIVRQES